MVIVRRTTSARTSGSDRELMKQRDSRLVVDDHSRTARVRWRTSAREHSGRIAVLHRHRRGRRSFRRHQLALAEPVDVLCQMDADLSHDPAQLTSLIAATANADVVIGSRYIPGGAIVNWPLRRRLLSRFANIYIRSVTRLSARDCTSGYRCWRRAALAALPLDTFFSDGYSFLVEMLFVAERRGCRVVEVPITFVERREGTSKVSRAVLLESAITPWRLVASPNTSERRLANPRNSLFMLRFRDILHVSRRFEASGLVSLSGVQRQRHHRQHGYSGGASRLGVDAGYEVIIVTTAAPTRRRRSRTSSRAPIRSARRAPAKMCGYGAALQTGFRSATKD